AEGIEHIVLDDEMRERGGQRLGGAADAGYSLSVCLLDVVFQGDRGRAAIGAHFHRLLRPPAAQVSQRELVANLADEVAAHDLDVLLVLEELEALSDNLEWQAEELAEVAAEHGPAQIEGLEDQVVEKGRGEAGLLERLWRGRGLGGSSVQVEGGAGR